MLRDLKFFRHNSGRNPQEGNENLPAGNQADSLSVSAVLDPSRPPLNTILESTQNPRTASEHEPDPRGKIERTPSKRAKKSDSSVGFRTPEKLGMGSLRSRFGWSQKVDVGSDIIGAQDEGSQAMGNHPSLVIHASSFGNASLTNTPRVARCGVRTLSNHSESGSTQSTPTKSVTKPPNSTFSHSNSSRPPLNLGTRTANFSLMSKGVSSACIPSTIVNTIEVPHLELKEDPSFWMDHNVQVLIRIRPLNNAEKNLQGYNRCLKQDSAQTVTWLGQPETRFTFDHVACETVNQEMLFRVVGLPMVENCLSGYNSSIFAYGQTGSGKTYTMLGEINELELRPSTDRGMTPRIFEFLFARIRAEEESRMDEKLKYNCKCSFLEIYNEQITDLLDSSSTNLLIREDIRKGVYVENLTEYEVETVNDILKLLIQGAANRKVAATNMNRESSRSHSVFTCVIESRWEKDSTINLRYARLNLVDLAGSERQKTSGAEGDRLKEAANINKSLSTLGHVIMVLVDLAQGGKHRHVPYRDSRLTFLLQDSLGGNSKTMIIANVSPSICSAAETLSTLKFAQRAKLIQNNAIVNEDASGDVRALQCQIHLLKEELSFLKRQNVSRSLSFQSASLGTTEGEGGNTTSENKMLEIPNRNSNDFQGHESSDTIRLSTKKLKSLETILAGALRREEMAESNVKHLQAEIEQLNRLVRQREEDGRCSKMLLRFREDKIQRMESLVNGLITTESYLAEQNDALSEEIRILQNRIDRNPEVTRFALENIRLLDQLRRFQEFYEEGEREILFSELSELRTQLFEFLSGRFSQHEHTVSKDEPQEIIFSGIPQTATKEDFLKKELDKTQVELNECRKSLKSCLECNENLTREIGELNSQLNKFRSKFCGQDDHSETLKFQEVLSSATMDEEHVIATIEKKEEEKARTDTNNHEIMFRHSEEIMNFQLELDILKIILDEERLSRNEVEQKASQLQKDLEVVKDELKDAKFVIEALESQQVLSINELDELRKNNNQYMELLTKRDSFLKQPKDEDSPLQAKLKRVQASLEYAKVANMRYQSDQASLTTQQQEMEEVQSQVEAETAEVIVCLQEELAMVQQQVDELSRKELEAREENKLLHGIVEERTAELSLLTEEWDKLACNVSDVLADGHIAIQEASDELEGFADSLLHRRIWVGEQMGRMVRLVVEKELLIEELQKSLDDAYKIRDDLEWKLRYLRGATLSLTESHQEERYEREKENLHLKSTIQEQKSVIIELENMLKTGEDRIRKAEVCATVAFLTVNRLSDKYLVHLKELKQEALKNEALRLHKSEEGHMEAEISDDILEAKGHLDELRRTVCTINSNIDEYVADVGRPNKLDNLEAEISANCYGKSGGRTEANEHTSKKVCDKDETIFLLRKEIESSLESLKGVQFQMADLLNEREDIKKAQKEDKKTIKDLRDQIIELERMMNGIEDFSQNRMLEMANQLQNLGEMVQNTKEEHRIELSEAKMLLAQKAAESFSLISKFEEAQATIAEADVMVNALVSANEAAKLEIEKYKQKETSLKTERDCLNIEVKSLQSCMNMMDQKYNNLEKQYTSNMAETKSLACLFEDILAEVESAFKQGLASIFCEMHDFRFQLMHCMNLARTWLEDVWSDIIAKDCAISVLHLCHIGILLETVTGLNAENSLLQHGLSESNSVISDLRESTFRAKRELEMCTSLKGKLLIDIKNGFNRITKNEEDSGKLSSRISLFEKKILDLQMQEEYMLALCNSMGSQLSALIKDVDGNYRNALTTLLSQERSAWEIEEVFRYSVSRWSDILSNGSCGRSSDPAECIPSDTDLTKNQVEFMIVNLFTKDIQLLIVSSELKEKISELNEMTIWKANKKDDQDKLGEALEHLSRELILVMTKEELAKLMLIEAKAELGNLENKGGAAKEKITEMKVEKKNLKKEIHCLREALDKQKLDLTSQTNDFNSRLAEATEVNETLSALICNLQSDKDSALKDQQRKEATLDSYLAQISGLQTELKMKEAELNDTQHSVYSLLNDLECERRESISLSAKVIAAEEKQLVCEIQESVNFKREMEKLSKVYEDIQAKLSKVEYSSNRLQERFGTLEACMTHLCMEFDLKMPELLELESSYSIIAKESDSLVKEIKLIEQKMLSFMCLDIHLLDLILDKVFQIISKSQSNDMLDNLLQEICNYEQLTCKFIAESECLETQAKELLFENLSLRSDLMRKEEIVKGLLFDLSLLQESTSKVTDQKDDFAEIEAHLESLEEDLAVKSNELDAALVHGQLLEKELQEKLHAIAALQLELGTAQESLHIVTQKNLEMKAEMVNLLLSKDTIQEELDEERKVIEQLEGENLKMSASIEKMNGFLEDLKCDFIKANQEKDYLASETIALKEQLEMAQALAEEHKAVATEAQQMAQMSKAYAEEKEEEAKLLEKSVEELECTINVLENKVELVRGEAEKQRMEREVLELELQALRHQILASQDLSQPSSSEENVITLQEAENKIQTFEKLVEEKDAEIAQCKMHITELNMHAEAQAREYKQKFKALEAMAQEVKPEPTGISHAATLATAKSEKNAVKSRASSSPHAGKSRGSGSPFKCIGLGLAHQFYSEKDEELTAGRLRIEELEALTASRQKEIFMLNARLAAAESMTHDVIRDLLGVKLDMSNCASLLDHQQIQKIAEKARLHNEESAQKDLEVAKLKQQLNAFINERQSWLDEINHKHAEMVAAHVALEKLRQRDQHLAAENEMLELENANQKKKVTDLEKEVKKLSGQQNLQQRIHHHAKIKEENNLLRMQNDDLSAKLQRSEIMLSRVKEELARYRSSSGKGSYIDIDEEQRLKKQLQDKEEERVQLAQKLLELCTGILKAAGITRSGSEINPSMAEEALSQLTERIASTERDLQDLKFKSKISTEKMRLSDLRQQSPLSIRTNENCPPTPVRPPTPLSPLSR